MPSACIARPKLRPRFGGWWNTSTRKGNATVPPPIGVEPATTEPKIITNAIGQCALTCSQYPKPNARISQATYRAATYANQYFMRGPRNPALSKNPGFLAGEAAPVVKSHLITTFR